MLKVPLLHKLSVGFLIKSKALLDTHVLNLLKELMLKRRAVVFIHRLVSASEDLKFDFLMLSLNKAKQKAQLVFKPNNKSNSFHYK